MSEDRTAETNGAKSFEDRVFGRFDAMDDRFGRIEVRIEKLEMKQYDTRPIWERALAAIAATNLEMQRGFAELRAEFGGLRAEVGELRAEVGELRAEVGELRTELRSDLATTNSVMNAGFEQGRAALSSALRGVERKIDVLNHNILDLQAEQRYVDSRLEKLESPPKPS